MGFAAIAQAGIFAPFSSWMSRRAWDRQAARPAASPGPTAPPLRLVPRMPDAPSIEGAPSAAAPSDPRAHALAPTRRPTPLRVVRIVEGRQNAQYAGRMVISGRMADVCAELERLAPQ